MTLDQQYEVDMQRAKINLLAEKIWDAINEVDYNPMHPCFEHLDDPVKDKVIEYATDIILGFPSCNE